MGVVSLIDKGAVVLDEFLYRRPETAGKGGKDGFVDEPFLGGVIGIVVNRDKVIEGFDQFGFGLGGVEVGRRRSPLFLGFLLLLLVSGVGRSLRGSRLCDNDRSDGRSGRLGWNDWREAVSGACASGGVGVVGMSFCYRWLVRGSRWLLLSGSGTIKF